MATNKKRTLQGAILIFLIVAVIIMVAAYTQMSGTVEKPELQASLSKAVKDGLPQVIHPIDLDRPFNFAGEPLPMDNFDVRERLDRELIINSYRHSTTILNIKNAYKYFPVIEPILRENGVPDDFKYMAVAESDLQNATSWAGAKGIWQFMEAMAEHYGLEVNREVDERYHIEKATRAACEYLKDTRKRFSSWTLAAAAYNLGGTSLAREMENQRTGNFYDLNLNEETSRYPFRLVAIKEILNRPDDFGFHIEDRDKYSPLSNYKVVRVDKPIPNLGDFAKEHGTSYRMLKVYNPWLRTYRLSNPSRKTYEIKIPRN
jgi:membrane-bound lytic murein transglycosylase D